MSQLRTSFDEATDGGNNHRLPRHDPRATREDYWWTWATEPTSGRLIVLGPHSTESEAYQDGLTHLGGLPFEVTPLNTRDRLYAKDKLNHIRLEKGGKVEDMMRRAKYKV